jgi:hypothetical protein
MDGQVTDSVGVVTQPRRPLWFQSILRVTVRILELLLVFLEAFQLLFDFEVGSLFLGFCRFFLLLCCGIFSPWSCNNNNIKLGSFLSLPCTNKIDFRGYISSLF